MKFSAGQTVKVTLPGCAIDGEIHEITVVNPKDFLQYVIYKDGAYYSFFERELTEASRVFAVYHQYYPQWKYEASLKSLWTTYELATEEVKRIKEKSDKYDDCFIEEIAVNVADAGDFI